MSDLAARLRKQREFTVEVGKLKFTVRRPTDVEALEIFSKGAVRFDRLATEFVVDWGVVVEDDIAGGGSQIPVPFDRELWEEWCADRTDFWQPIGKKILSTYQEHAEKMDAVGKN